MIVQDEQASGMTFGDKSNRSMKSHAPSSYQDQQIEDVLSSQGPIIDFEVEDF